MDNWPCIKCHGKRRNCQEGRVCGRRSIGKRIPESFFTPYGISYEKIYGILEAKRRVSRDINAILTAHAPAGTHAEDLFEKAFPELQFTVHKRNASVFGKSQSRSGVKMDSMKSMFLNLRKKLAVKLQNPRLKEVTFHSFRHWKATMLMHQTHRDQYYVQKLLGHKSSKNTEIYLHMESIIFGESGNDEFTVKVAEKPQEIKELLELGFDYVCQKDNLIFLRKRK